MTADSPRPTLTFPSDLRMLGVARAFVEAVCGVHGLDRATTHAIVLATGEAISNIVRHAHQGRPGACIQIACCLAGDCFAVDVLDEGEPFDLETVPDLDPAELRVGGRGVFLMRALMDELSCRPRGERGNVLHMVKHVARPSDASDAASIRECG
jgi:serine/threonine-protein kinase RsbW